MGTYIQKNLPHPLDVYMKQISEWKHISQDILLKLESCEWGERVFWVSAVVIWLSSDQAILALSQPNPSFMTPTTCHDMEVPCRDETSLNGMKFYNWLLGYEQLILLTCTYISDVIQLIEVLVLINILINVIVTSFTAYLLRLENFSVSYSYRVSIGQLGWGISPLQGHYIHKLQQNRNTFLLYGHCARRTCSYENENIERRS